MDFSALSQLREQTQAQQNRRQQSSDSHYQKGLEFFARASNSQFRNKQALNAAFEAWIEAIKHNRQNAKPCVGVGYIFLILGDQRSALSYFKAALKIEPENSDARMFIGSIEQQALQSTKQAIGYKPLSQAEADSLYDQAEQLMQLRLRQMMTQALPGPCFEASERQQLDQLCHEHSEALAQIQQMLKRLDREMDIASLNRQFWGLESTLKRYLGVQELSAQYARLAHKIQQAAQRAAALTSQLQQKSLPLTEAEAELEELLDLCDQSADQLDAYEAQGHAIEVLLPDYEQLTAAVARLQDTLDG